jgi:HD-like signal output (HDOD) protein|tara:strand:+ start:167 stop:409 length:243 start_codon:yes stop_codon:yes gene_type:complete
MEKDTLLNTKDIRTPLWIIAISTASFILFIGVAVMRSWIYPEGEDIRIQHLQQHHDEQVKFDQMIELLEKVEENTEENSD